MAPGPQTIHSIPRATASVSLRLAVTLFVNGPLREHAAALSDLFQCVRVTAAGQSLMHFRRLSDAAWQSIVWGHPPAGFEALFGYPDGQPGSWGVELSEDPLKLDGNLLEIADLVPTLDVERASYVRLLFDERTPIAQIASLAQWSVNNFPVWWGSAGWIFRHTAGRTYPAYLRVAALAKRYWGIQIQNLTTLQWDALHGMPGVNWLSLIGREFASGKGLDLTSVASDAEKILGVFQRQGSVGLVLAAGSRPTKGDINAGEGVAAYRAIARLIAPLLLTRQTPLSGPFERPEVVAAWLGRFQNPRAWTECDISD